MTTDVFIDKVSAGYFDLFIDDQGDLTNGDFFDSSLLYSLLGERRANASEVTISNYRRGWIGSEDDPYENGSKIWIYYQERITRSVLSGVQTEASASLQWLVDDGFLANVEVRATVQDQQLTLIIDLFRFNSKVDRRFFQLWENTGVTNAA